MKDRDEIIAHARMLYIDTGVTRNITEALRMFLEQVADPDEMIEIFITSPEQHQIREVLKFGRPECDFCDTEMHLKICATDMHGVTHQTSWLCKNCGYEFYSDLTPRQWLEELRSEARREKIPGHGQS